MDDSKQTEEADISRSDFTETHSQDTIRNFQKVANEKVAQIETIDLRKAADGYQNLPEEDQTQRSDKRSPSKSKKHQNAQSVNNISMNVFTQEEEKTHDLIKHDLYDEDEDHEDHIKQQDRRVHTDGASASFDYIAQNSTTEKKASKNPNKIGTFSMKPHLPQLKLNVPLALSSNDIFEIFANISKNQRFQVIEMEQNIATAVNKEPFSIKRMFMRCLPFQEFKREQPTESFISAIRLQISVNEVKCCRKIALKGLYGEYNRLQEFSNAFRNRIHEQVNQLPDDKKSVMNNSSGSIKSKGHKKSGSSKIVTTLAGGKNIKTGFQMMDDDDSDNENKQFTETSHQGNQQLYCLNLYILISFNNFQMEGLMGLVNETVHAFHSEYNLGKDTAKGLMPYCRPAVEKYVFSKLYDKLFAMYAIKNEDEDRLFVERSSVIKRMKAQEIMQYLGIRDKFIIGDNQIPSLQYNSSSRMSYLDQSKFQSAPRDSNAHLFKQVDSESKDHIVDNNSSQYDSHRSADLGQYPMPSASSAGENHYIFNNSSTSSSLGLAAINKQELPYYEAIKSIEKIQQFTSPREKLQCISESYSLLKTIIVDYWKGKVELNTMDDVLPLTIYAVAMADLTHPVSEYNIMDDYLSIYDKGFELERKLLTNFDVSIKYVNHEWQLPQ